MEFFQYRFCGQHRQRVAGVYREFERAQRGVGFAAFQFYDRIELMRVGVGRIKLNSLRGMCRGLVQLAGHR